MLILQQRSPGPYETRKPESTPLTICTLLLAATFSFSNIFAQDKTIGGAAGQTVPEKGKEPANTGSSAKGNEDKPLPKFKETPEEEVEEEHPMLKKVAEVFPDPADAKRMLDPKKGRLWVDTKNKVVIVDGYVALERGPLELFACPTGTKEHEAVVAVFAQSRYVHAALLAVEANPGHPVKHTPEYIPALGQRIGIEIQWKDAAGKLQTVDAKQWVRYFKSKKPLDIDWVFAGSGWWQDERTAEQLYKADSGDLICVSNFTSAALDLPIESSDKNAYLEFEANEGRVPARLTPVRLTLRPLPDRIPVKTPSPSTAPATKPDATNQPEPAKPAQPVKPQLKK